MIRFMAMFAFWLIQSFAFTNVAQNLPMLFGPRLPPYFKLERYCENEIKSGRTVGAAVAVVEDGRVTFMKGFGKIKQSDASLINTDTVFQLGSASKPIAASLVAIANKRGKISLSTPIAIAKSKYPLLEARHVLSHTTGFKRIGWNWQIEHGASRQKLLDLFSKREQELPGSVYDYHNVAFSLIEPALAQALAMPFDKALHENLFGPLGMKRTTVGFVAFEKQTNKAWPHEKNQRGKYVESSAYSHRYHDTVMSAAGVNSSINDMAKFLLLNVGGYSEILTAEDLSIFHSALVSAPDANKWFKDRISGDYSCHYGLGFRILKYGDDEIVFHGGWLKGFASFLAFSPKKKKGIVVLSNTESSFALSTAINFFRSEFNNGN